MCPLDTSHSITLANPPQALLAGFPSALCNALIVSTAFPIMKTVFLLKFSSFYSQAIFIKPVLVVALTSNMLSNSVLKFSYRLCINPCLMIYQPSNTKKDNI